MTMLKNIEITNFRGFRDKTPFHFDCKPLVLLTAPNGKGKTTLLDAIEWCLTGDVYRLHQIYNERNPNKEGNLKSNEETILKNKEQLSDLTTVILQIEKDGQQYSIVRSQKDDTLDNPGVVRVDNMTGDQAQQMLASLVDRNNFYKYHVCDMQKTYNFLRNGRSDMSKEFADFTANHSDAEHVIANLDNYCDDIEKRIKRVQQVPGDIVKIYRDILQKYEKLPDILPYDTHLLYSSEQTDLQKMTTDQLNDQLRTLYSCGYARAKILIMELEGGLEAKKKEEELETLKKEFEVHRTEILEAVKTGAREPSVRKKSEEKLRQYKGITLNADNLAGNSEELFKIGSSIFDVNYWKDSSSKLSGLKKQSEVLDKEISILKKGSAVIDTLTAISTGRKSLLQYRAEQKESKPNLPVLCPVCGSENFDTIAEDEITKQALDYQSEHKKLIEKKKLELANLKEQQRVISTEQLTKAKTALKEAIDAGQKLLDTLTNLYNTSRLFFTTLEKLQKEDKITFTQEKMLSIDGILEAENKNSVAILSADQAAEVEKELDRIQVLIQYSNKGHLTGNALFEDICSNAGDVPEHLVYNEDLLHSKINSVRSHIRNSEYLDASKKLNEAEEKNAVAAKQIGELNALSVKAKSYADQIRGVLRQMNIQEYNNVGPYLYKIFRKLSRDVNISGIHLKSGRGDGLLALVDDQNRPILNMLSDGQLSVFMLSYFLGNAFRLKGTEPFQVYFVDDITSCMDVSISGSY